MATKNSNSNQKNTGSDLYLTRYQRFHATVEVSDSEKKQRENEATVAARVWTFQINFKAKSWYRSVVGSMKRPIRFFTAECVLFPCIVFFHFLQSIKQPNVFRSIAIAGSCYEATVVSRVCIPIAISKPRAGIYLWLAQWSFRSDLVFVMN